MKSNKVGQDFNCTGIKYPMAIDSKPYPRWTPVAFWVSVSAVIAVSVFGFINF